MINNIIGLLDIRKRMARKHYIFAQLFLIVFIMLVFIVLIITNSEVAQIIATMQQQNANNSEMTAVLIEYLGSSFFITVLINQAFSVIFAIRRLKDINVKWFFVILLFLPFISWLLVIFLCIKPSSKENITLDDNEEYITNF